MEEALLLFPDILLSEEKSKVNLLKKYRKIYKIHCQTKILVKFEKGIDSLGAARYFLKNGIKYRYTVLKLEI